MDTLGRGVAAGDGATDLPDPGQSNVVPFRRGPERHAGLPAEHAPSTCGPELAQDLVTVRLPRGSRVLVAGDLHLAVASTAASRWATRELARRIESWRGPGAVVLAGDVFELLEPGMDQGVGAALRSHAGFAQTLRRFSSEPDHAVVCLVGNHDGRLAWDDESAVAVREALGCRLALAACLELTTEQGVRRVLVEHGHQLDPANAFVDPRSPNDTPLGHHVVRELLPPLQAQGDSWLEGVEGLADPFAFPDFVASRLVWRRMLRRPWWLVVPFAVALLLRLPLTYRFLTNLGHPLTTAELTRRVLLVALFLVGDLFLLGALVLVGARRMWTTAGQRLVGPRGSAQNDAARARARGLVAQGYAGLVTGHTHQPELTAVEEGFYANTGSGTQVVRRTRARFGLPPVYLPALQLSWVEIVAARRLRVRLFRGTRSIGAGTWLERRMALADGEGPPHPVLAGALQEPFADSGGTPQRPGRVETLLQRASDAERRQTMRVLIVSATVGEGHDAAARGLAEDIERSHPDAEVRIVNGLKAVSPLLDRFIVRSYRFQLDKAPWSYEWLYTSIIRSRRFARFLYSLCGVVGGRRMRRLVHDEDPDVVISTYPLTSAMLAWLKERGRLDVACANILTDLAPHPMWVFDGLDVNFVMHPATMDAVHEMIGTPPLEVVAPPVAARFHRPPGRSEARSALGIPPEVFVVLVVGGGWGVGELRTTAWAASSLPGVVTVVVCARNEGLRAALVAAPPPRSIVLGFVDNMPELMDAADVMVHNAGGLTCLEAFVRGCPVVVTDPIPGHGVACADLMARIGAVHYVRDRAALPVALAACTHDDGLKKRAAGLQAQMASAPTASSRLARLVDSARREAASKTSTILPFPAPRRRRRGRVAAVAVAVASLGLLGSSVPVSLAAGRMPAVRSGGRHDGRPLALGILAQDGRTATAAARVLTAAGGRATFFVPGATLRENPSLGPALSAAGELGNAGTGSPLSRLTGVARIRRDVSAAADDVAHASGRRPAYYLPVSARLTPAAYIAASREDESIVVGSRTVRTAGDLLRPLEGGEIVILDLSRSPASEDEPLLEGLLDRAWARHLDVVDLSELRAARP